MKWEDGRKSDNVEDRRDGSGPSGGDFPGGFGRGFPAGMGGGIKLGGFGMVVVIVLALVFGIDPGALLQDGMPAGPGGGASFEQPAPRSPFPPPTARNDGPGEDRMKAFVASVLGSTEDVWREVFRAQGWPAYRDPTLVLFSGATRTECGAGQAAMGPFYCPADSKVYIDLVFFDELARRFGAPGDFAQAYVIGHEIGHHVQALLGISDRANQLRRQMSREQYNRVSVQVELQADCFAGVWAFHANRQRRWLEPGDVEEAMRAAAAIGDDRLQRQAQGHVVPDSFTHGSSEQRVRWLKRGLETGDVRVCDTFNARQL